MQRNVKPFEANSFALGEKRVVNVTLKERKTKEAYRVSPKGHEYGIRQLSANVTVEPLNPTSARHGNTSLSFMATSRICNDSFFIG